MKYHQLTSEERYTLCALKKEGLSDAAIGEHLGRHRSTIGREFRRNRTTHDDSYRPEKAQAYANGRRRRSRRGPQFSEEFYAQVDVMLEQLWSPKRFIDIYGVIACKVASFTLICGSPARLSENAIDGLIPGENCLASA